MKRIFFSITILLVVATANALASDPLKQGFRTPPDSAKALTWWHWMNGNVSKEGITEDLESMKRVGVHGAQLFNVNLGHPPGSTAYLNPEWLDLFKFAAEEADRLGLELAFHNGPGWSSSGGPWVTPDLAMQELVFSEVTHQGGKPFKARLPQPKTQLDYYQDIAILAFPTPKVSEHIHSLDYKTLSGKVRNRLMPESKTIPADAVIRAETLIDLTDRVSDEGLLNWNAPAGQWTILRLGYTPTGARNRPGVVGGQGLECDKMSRKAVDAFWKDGIDPIIQKLGPLIGTAVTKCHIDSYEVGTANWTKDFETEFKRLRGYDCSDFLPALAGYYVESGDVSERFLWDFRRTIGDLMAENYYGRFRELSHQHGMVFSLEPYWGPFDNMQVGEAADVVMAEFWSGVLAFFDSPKFVASIAKLNGSSIAESEAFTSTGGWDQSPATLKAIGDRAWAQGINRFVYHTYVHQPWDAKPGLTLGPFGISFNRHNTWWEQGKAYMDYVARSQFLLQQGQTVADVLVFVGESSPNDTFLVPGIEELGFNYDLIGHNKLAALTVEDGKIYTPFGDAYSILMLPETTWMRPETLGLIRQLAKAGATITGPKPTRSPSLQGYPACDDQLAEMADALWDTGIIRNDPVLDMLQQGTLSPDFRVVRGSDENLDVTHRRAGETEIYFLANSQKNSRVEECRFRVAGKQPEFWDAMTGEISNAAVWHDHGDGTTTVRVQLESEASVFVIFQKPAAASDSIVEVAMNLNRTAPTPLPDLKIVKAQYGTFLPAGLIDVKEIVESRIKNGMLSLNATRSELCQSDPAPGYHKELRVEYQIGDQRAFKYAKERERLEIDANGKGELTILKAVFGKFELGVEGVPSVYPVHDVTDRIESLIDAGKYQIAVDDGLVEGASVVGHRNTLRLVYSSGVETFKQTVAAGKFLKLTQPTPEPTLLRSNRIVTWKTPCPGTLTCKMASGQTVTAEVKSVPAPIELTGSWNVEFPPNLGAPKSEVINKLASWTTSPIDGIRYFSGTANYQKQFHVPENWVQSDYSIELDLGRVHVMAKVIVNGKNLGVFWKAPFRINLDKHAKAGVNDLEVRVTNLWPNRLIGDEQLPDDVKRRGPNVKQWPDWLSRGSQRPTNRITFQGYKHWSKDSELKPSGLLGPVLVRPYVRAVVQSPLETADLNRIDTTKENQ
ncbi:glycosyl hydrolase [Rubripirellula obstinata]|nr:glycosyl hydrolase [Rubripirellula obstinata]